MLNIFSRRETHTNPIQVRDALSGRTTRFRVYANAEPSDNPMQSEIAGNIGGLGNHNCRKCFAGGTDAEIETDEGFESLFHVRHIFYYVSELLLTIALESQPGEPRTKEGVIAELHEQVRLACKGVAKPIKERQTATGVKDAYTQYWIDQLIERARSMKKANPRRSKDDIDAELTKWVEEHQDEINTPFYHMIGML